ncbi:MAG: pseudouridine synthase [Desulfonatronovibrionaceae bacterium]
MSSSLRLNKFLARAGVCSRRKADELIARGAVRVNHEPVRQMGIMVDPGRDVVTVEHKVITLMPSADTTYLILNKPPGVVTTVHDPEKRRTVMDFVPNDHKNKRLVPVGRLDFFSQGLLLLTNDGPLVHRMTHPSWKQPKVYQVTVREKPSRKALDIVAAGMTLACGQKLAPVQARIIRSQDQAWVLEMVLYQGINRQIRRMCQDLGLTILKLVRSAQGPLSLGNLPEGKTRELSPAEVRSLKKSSGMAD